ncbi:MAG TPA: NAD-dependent epimerase/dehydratase family protein [Candidatus Kapabacteria bacterium]|nr:NAD-dependent epimerase/dehydratase family protein [Candidatus Kapabacteria bacterium]
MRYFITGATGFIGGVIARQLCQQGHHVAALVRSPSRATALQDLGVELHAGDITERESMREAMRGADGVFHVAGWYRIGSRDTSRAERINVEGTRNVLTLMWELGVPRGVYTSTLAVFSDTHGRMADESYYYGGRHISEYDRTKWHAHYNVALPLMREGLPLVIVMPGLVYGPGDTSSVRETFRQYLRGKLPMTPRRTAFCWAHVEDVAHAHVLAMERGRVGEAYIIAGEPRSFIEAFEIAEKITGVKAPRMHPGPIAMKIMAAIMKVLGVVLPLPPSYRAESLRTVAGVTYLGSNAKARSELGYQPRSLEAGLRETLLADMRDMGMRAPEW